MWDDLKAMYTELENRFPPGFPYDRNGVRLGIAALEDEVQEVWTEWNIHKRNMSRGCETIRTELLQVASVAMLMIAGIDDRAA